MILSGWIVAESMQNRHTDQLLDHLEENRSLITIIYNIIELKFKLNFYIINSPLCDLLVSENSRSRLNNGRLITEHNLCPEIVRLESYSKLTLTFK